MANSLEEVF